MAHGALAARIVLEEGMKLGYQDAGSLRCSIDAARPAQGGLALRAVHHLQDASLKKSHVGLTFIRDSDIWDKSFTERAPKLGGLIEFYRSPARVQWTPTGNNVPDYPKLAQLWWQNIGDASLAPRLRRLAMDALAAAQDSVLERLERSGVQGVCGPKLNPKQSAEDWFAKAEADGNSRPAQARQREAEGRDGRLRHADQVVAGDAAEALGIEAPQAAALGKTPEAADYDNVGNRAIERNSPMGYFCGHAPIRNRSILQASPLLLRACRLSNVLRTQSPENNAGRYARPRIGKRFLDQPAQPFIGCHCLIVGT